MYKESYMVKVKNIYLTFAYNPGYWEAAIRRTAVLGQPRQKVSKTQSRPKAGHSGS
jgi:hypothetical protein